ncbi:AAA family ATPase [Daejeonella sp.]|uniref:AAA family ATPase n=1 Tax=Daejeonella sp. TaxID=2805397 RepID=UPI002731AEEA|nr:AAA family ATPase [Daejeonella sp.]MDP2414817.1 AAA family ATPase [Daejeonella sp.]
MESKQNIFPKGTVIADRYEIQFPIGSNSFVQSYRAKNKSGNIIRLDLINLASLPSSFFEEGKLIQVSLLKKIKHTNISALKEEGETIIDKQKFAYLTFDFISGETLAEKLKREGKLSPYEAVPIVTELLEAIEYLHNKSEPIIHNGILPTSIFLDLSTKREKPVLTGFEQARTLENSNQSVSIKGLSFFHSAPELLNGVFIPQSDLFSVGALLHHLLFGVAPWYNENILSQPLNKVKGLVEQAREKKLSFDFADENEIDDQLKFTLTKALSIDIEQRFQTAEDFSKALKREVMLEKQEVEKSFEKKIEKKEKKKGSGFDQIAGMSELKEILYTDVIRALSEKELYASYGITIPNGMLLYGPPGCGKTFIAQKFADEIGYNFVMIKPSDLKSKWVNATEENIGKLFKEAEANAPTIIFIDELDAIVPSREGDLHQGAASAVNEVLAQMTNCGERGIFVIGATNRPEKIDAAILRAGRLDKTIYLSPPDKAARAAMFKLYLKDRPVDLSVDYDILSLLTENYVSSDIKFLIDEASRQALKVKSRITMEVLQTVIKTNKPSVTLKEINKYVALKQKWDNEKGGKDDNDRTPIGFK